MNIVKSTSLLSLCALVLAGSLAAAPSASAEDESYRAIVFGGKKDPVEHVKAFNETLKRITGQQNLSEAFIECRNCAELEEVPAKVKTLIYYFLRSKPASQAAIWQAWSEVEASSPSSTFTLTFDAEAAPGSLCEQYVSPPCAPRAFCQSMGGCSKQATPLACKKCDLK